MADGNERIRLPDIDRAKGLAIFLVVLGHLWSRGTAPPMASGYVYLKNVIYMFHMPFFMFLSGLIFYYSYKNIENVDAYCRYAKKKILRLAPAYILFGTIIFAAKLLLSGHVYVENARLDTVKAFTDIFLVPSKSVAGSLWYIYVLLQLYLLVPIMLIVFRQNIFAILAISVIIHFVPVTSYLMLDLLFEYIIYFALGMIVIKYFETYLSIVDRYFTVFLLLFVASFSSVYFFDHNMAKLIIGTCSIPALHGLVRKGVFSDFKFLYSLGAYAFSIYLMNGIAIGLVKAITFEFASLDQMNFLLFNLLLLASGLALPIFAKKYVFKHVKYIDQITS